MQYFHTQQIETGAAKHLPFQKFEPIDKSPRDAVTFRPGASCVHSGIIPKSLICEKRTSLAFFKRNENRIGKESHERLVKKEKAMKMMAGICLLLLTFGMILGWFLLGGFSGSAIGLC